MNWSERSTWDTCYSQLCQQGRETVCELKSELKFNKPIKAFLDQSLAGIEDGVLDIGSGPFSNTYLDPRIKYVRADFSPKAFFLHFRNTASVVANTIVLPFPNDTFNAVVSKETYAYQTEPARMIQEMIRVLRQGGKFILIDSKVNLPANQIGRAVDFRPELLIPQITKLGVRDTQVFRLKDVSSTIDGKVANGHISALVGVKS